MVVPDADAFVDRYVELAAQPQQLAVWRQELRQRMRARTMGQIVPLVRALDDHMVAALEAGSRLAKASTSSARTSGDSA